MTTLVEISKSAWDFSHVLDFVSALTPGAAPSSPPKAQDVSQTILKPLTKPANPTHHPGNANDPARLGDFSKVWQFLGTRHDSQPLSPDTELLPNIAPTKDDYASDGATYRSKRDFHPRIVHWSDGTDGEDAVASASDNTNLSKSQRKKLRRKERKAAEQAKAIKQATVSESEAEIASKQTPARKASAHVVPNAQLLRYGLRERDPNGRVKVLTHPNPKTAGPPAVAKNATSEDKAAMQTVSNRQQNIEVTDTIHKSPINIASSLDDGLSDQKAANAVQMALAALQLSQLPSTPSPKPRGILQQSTSKMTSTLHNNNAVPSPHSHSASVYMKRNLIPSSLQLKSIDNSAGLPAIQANVTVPSSASTSKVRNIQPVIEPIVVRSGEDRHWALLMKIIGDFYEDRKHLISPMNLTTHNNNPKGIHIFVDASNIFIGFMDQLKRSRNIHPQARVSQAHLSFDGLALLMERRRPVAKRVLVGSTPRLPAIDKAEAVGYRCHMLDKVYKARELTERQIYFKELDAQRLGKKFSRPAPPSNTVLLGNGATPVSPALGGEVRGSGSGSETNTPQYAPPKMIEQGVDEILHLSMMESVVDADEPSTMVLATGDAAAAEYSDGFMAMVQRALKKGWKVELVSWSKNISGMYKREQWTRIWGEQFRIIYLDDYAEELLDM